MPRTKPLFFAIVVLILGITAQRTVPFAYPQSRSAAKKGNAAKLSPGSAQSQRSKTKSAPKKRVDEGQSRAFAAVGRLIRATVRFGPTLVVWFIDRTESAVGLSKAVGGDIESLYQQMASEGLIDEPTPQGPQRLLTSVVSFGKDAEFLIDQPTADLPAILEAFSGLRADESGREVPFTAIKAALEKYAPMRREDRREVLFIVVTNEAGEDGQFVDQIVPTVEQLAIPVYVMGAPSPFGKVSALSQFTEGPADLGATDGQISVRHGPESRYPEVVDFGFLGQGFLGEVFESGFGPFELERLCRRSGGKFLMLEPPAIDPRNRAEINQRWPSPDAVRFAAPPSRYAPDYVTESEYQRLLDENKARAAVIKASKFKAFDAPFSPRLMFEKRSEAELNQILTQAQQAAAKLSPIVEQLYQAIQEGEADRAKLSGARWQASFDLAFGRASAAKANVDGYNAMLAELKRKSDFKNPGSKVWVLEPANTIEAGSALQKLIDKAQQSLKRVMTEHSGTPWAKIAERELETPIGWKWTER